MKIIDWFKKSNRYKHFLYAIPIGFILTILCVIGVASGMEFKDSKWDWTDWWCTVAGGVVGQVLQLLLIWIIL